MDDCEFTFGGRHYRVTAPFDAGAALSAARRVGVAAEWLDGGTPGDDPTRHEDWWRLSDVLSRIERENDDGSREPMAWGESLHDDLDDMRDAVALFEVAARHLAIAQLQSLPPDQCGAA